MGLAASAAGGGEAVADLDALDGLDAHHRGRQPGVQAGLTAHVRTEADRHSGRDDLDHAAEGVAVLLRRLDLGDHRLLGVGVEGADRTGVDGLEVGDARWRTDIRIARADRDDVGDDVDAEHLTEEVTGDGAGRDACRGLPSAGAFEHRAGVVEAVLEHARVVGVAGPGTGQRCVAGAALEFGGVHGVGCHHRLPLGPLGVADLDGDRAAHGLAVADPAEHGHLVGLELHPSTAAVAESAASQLLADVGRGDLDAGHHALDDGDQGGPVGFSGSYPAQHSGRLFHAPAPRPTAAPPNHG